MRHIGEIRTTGCDEYRNGLCVESDASENGFTTASCRTNNALLCLSQNKDAEKLAKCEDSPDCFAKHVEFDKFKFDVRTSSFSFLFSGGYYDTESLRLLLKPIFLLAPYRFVTFDKPKRVFVSKIILLSAF